MTLLVGSIFHMTRKIVSEMTYNVSMGTLNPTIPYLPVLVACAQCTMSADACFILVRNDFDLAHSCVWQ